MKNFTFKQLSFYLKGCFTIDSESKVIDVIKAIKEYKTFLIDYDSLKRSSVLNALLVALHKQVDLKNINYREYRKIFFYSQDTGLLADLENEFPYKDKLIANIIIANNIYLIEKSNFVERQVLYSMSKKLAVLRKTFEPPYTHMQENLINKFNAKLRNHDR